MIQNGSDINAQRNYNPRQSRERQVLRQSISVFLLPAFESGFWCSRNGSPPVIWIISLYQVHFVIIIVEFLVTVLSITYLKIFSDGGLSLLGNYLTI